MGLSDFWFVGSVYGFARRDTLLRVFVFMLAPLCGSPEIVVIVWRTDGPDDKAVKWCCGPGWSRRRGKVILSSVGIAKTSARVKVRRPKVCIDGNSLSIFCAKVAGGVKTGLVS
jgi:hypothetical protein